MGYFSEGCHMFPPTLDTARRMRTVIDGQWGMEIRPRDTGVEFVARNNLYSEWLWEVREHGFFFNLAFGCYITRLERAKKKYQRLVDKKNATFFHAEQVLTII